MICDGCGNKNSLCRGHINTDTVRLRNLDGVVYVGVAADNVNNFEILHFNLYFKCPVCGYEHEFSKDDAPYYAIRFMANYPCLECGNYGGFSAFSIIVSPDAGITESMDTCIDEPTFKSNIEALISMWDLSDPGNA